MIKQYVCYLCGHEFENDSLHYKYIQCPKCGKTIIEKESVKRSEGDSKVDWMCMVPDSPPDSKCNYDECEILCPLRLSRLDAEKWRRAIGAIPRIPVSAEPHKLKVFRDEMLEWDENLPKINPLEEFRGNIT
jgi:DNA-directed RNA polymerase subunit RPC12/RpoP